MEEPQVVVPQSKVAVLHPLKQQEKTCQINKIWHQECTKENKNRK